MIYPDILIVSNLHDFSTDLVCAELNSLQTNYLRINRDEFKTYKIAFNPIKAELTVEIKNVTFKINSTKLKSIYYRAPTFLREVFVSEITEEEQLERTQWAAFIRSLVVFENATWFNNPSYIYKAEIKSYQLYTASNIGFNVPETVVTNYITPTDYHQKVAIKSIDTALVSNKEEEGFVYTNIYSVEELENAHYTSPFFIQEALIPKVDIRVTVIKNTVIGIDIRGDKLLEEDWRKYKYNLNYNIISLPTDIELKCIQLLEKLNLNFGAIDLVLMDNQYYFIEINPTGEWSWLQQNTGYKFDTLIAKSLIEHE
ncbi:MAG: hypothetical protein LIP06_14145 [Tannerellaceae bacterium]|nr:hypothetical protein [Tannerellaceae bacterium]